MPQGSQDRIRELVASLSDDQQSAVEAFIRYLREKGSPGSKTDIHTALDEFIREHSELLRRLAH